MSTPLKTWIRGRPRYYVQLKKAWTDAWRTVEHLFPTTWFEALAPQMPMAYFAWDVGEFGQRGTVGWFPEGLSDDWLSGDLDDTFVRIMAVYQPIRDATGIIAVGYEEQVWIGVVASDVRSMYGAVSDEPVQPGAQTLTAVGLAHLLNKKRIDRAFYVNRDLNATGQIVVPSQDNVEVIRWAPDFNRSAARGEGAGNKSDPALQGVMYPADTPAFSYNPVEMGAFSHFFNDADVARYLLRFWQPAGDQETPMAVLNDPVVTDIEFVCKDYSRLYGQRRIIEQNGRSVFELLNALASADAGLAWAVVCEDAGSSGVMPEVKFFSRFGRDVSFGSTTIAGPAVTVSPTLAGMRPASEVIVETDHQRRYDCIRVTGERMVSCFNLSVADVSLEAGWSSILEGIYKQGGAAASQYHALSDKDKARFNDMIRAEDRFADVFAKFRPPWAWNQYVNDGEAGASAPQGEDPWPLQTVNPWIDKLGQVNRRYPIGLWRHGRRLLSWVPLYDEIDYSVHPPAPLVGFALARQPELRKPFVVTRDYGYEDEGHWRQSHDPTETLSGGRLSVVRDEQAIRVTFNPKHAAGREHWSTAEPSRFDPSEGLQRLDSVDYHDYIAVVAFETDQRLQLVVDLPDPSAARRELELAVSGAHLWYIAPSTVVGISPETGELIRTPGVGDPLVAVWTDPQGNRISNVGHNITGVVRNDYQILEAVAAVASEWYGTARRSLVYRLRDRPSTLKPGDFVAYLDPGTQQQQEVNTLVARVTVSNAQEQVVTTVQTGEAQVNPIAVVQRAGGI